MTSHFAPTKISKLKFLVFCDTVLMKITIFWKRGDQNYFKNAKIRTLIISEVFNKSEPKFSIHSPFCHAKNSLKNLKRIFSQFIEILRSWRKTLLAKPVVLEDRDVMCFSESLVHKLSTIRICSFIWELNLKGSKIGHSTWPNETLKCGTS